MVIFVSEAADPRLEPYRGIRERDLSGRHRGFIAEGEVVLRVLLAASRFPVESILVSEKRLPAVADLLSTAPPPVPVYVAAQGVMNGIVGFPIHRGVLAIGRREEPRRPDELVGSATDRAIVLGLIGIVNHDNMGGIFRNAAAFGADAVLLDGTCCDPLYRKAIRVSVGASLIVPFVRAGTPEALVSCLSDAGFHIVALSPSGSLALQDLKPSGKIALLLGAEGAGLPREILDTVSTARIPMASGFDSLNVATASGIALHHIAAMRGPALALSGGAG